MWNEVNFPVFFFCCCCWPILSLWKTCRGHCLTYSIEETWRKQRKTTGHLQVYIEVDLFLAAPLFCRVRYPSVDAVYVESRAQNVETFTIHGGFCFTVVFSKFEPDSLTENSLCFLFFFEKKQTARSNVRTHSLLSFQTEEPISKKRETFQVSFIRLVKTWRSLAQPFSLTCLNRKEWPR